ncbi:MAG: hypothetical protein P0Y65_02390 [Candidatus Devosia phytovorans]|uniref:Uncharacterized protein n=1 Tax=Candidatus Devosia phytovorans TaxID=3121372 RepID=A0AAJ6B245_9HYPH|nr:hypothetical protein [Devosia sp.]WEK05123.1 MAG: hypothetical protein P0Y65_02390 [Devosia sp.]
MKQQSIYFYSDFIKGGLSAAFMLLVVVGFSGVAAAATLPNDLAICQSALTDEHLPQSTLAPTRISLIQKRMSAWNGGALLVGQHAAIAATEIEASAVCPAKG